MGAPDSVRFAPELVELLARSPTHRRDDRGALALRGVPLALHHGEALPDLGHEPPPLLHTDLRLLEVHPSIHGLGAGSFELGAMVLVGRVLRAEALVQRLDPPVEPGDLRDGARHDVLDGKAAASTRTTCNIFELLERSGVRTHFVDRVDDVTFRARNVEMIPLELVARRYASGSFRDRFPDLPDGAVFEELMFEIFEKDDANHDPLLDFDFEAGVLRRHVPNKKAAEAIGPDVKAGDLITEESLGESRFAGVSPELIASLRSRTVSAFEVIEEAWKQHGGVYIDFKIECGFDRETGNLLVADVIDSDSGRLRFGDVDMSKQSYRDGTATLPEIKKKFDEVAALTDRFV